MSDQQLKDKLLKRHNERLENMEKRRQTRLKEKISNGETSTIFLEDFNKAKREIITILNRVNTPIPGLDISLEFNEISKKLLNLQKFISDSSMFLPSYDLRRAQEIVGKLRQDINERREILLPKKKFAFKSRQKLKTQINGEEISSAEIIKSPLKYRANDVPRESLGASNLSGETISLSMEQCNEKDVSISNLVDCFVYIYGYPSALRVQNVTNTEVYCGPVSRSIFITDCSDSIFHLACQQLRVHATVSTNFFIHVTSRAIIEDCEEVGFGCFQWTYPLLLEHYVRSGLDITKNNWKQVDDFNWLKLDEQSPNWFTLES